jgi:hypothetical protein
MSETAATTGNVQDMKKKCITSEFSILQQVDIYAGEAKKLEPGKTDVPTTDGRDIEDEKWIVTEVNPDGIRVQESNEEVLNGRSEGAKGHVETKSGDQEVLGFDRKRGFECSHPVFHHEEAPEHSHVLGQNIDTDEDGQRCFPGLP